MNRLAPGLVLLALASVAGAQQMRQLSPEARQALMQLASACRDDAARDCNGTEPGGGRILMCLKAHASSLSPGCARSLQSARSAFLAARGGPGG